MGNKQHKVAHHLLGEFRMRIVSNGLEGSSSQRVCLREEDRRQERAEGTNADKKFSNAIPLAESRVSMASSNTGRVTKRSMRTSTVGISQIL